LASSPDRFLPTVQIGITLVGTLAAAYGGDHLVGDFAGWIERHAPPALAAASRTIALTVFVMGLSFVTLLLGELVPKRLALRRAESFARIAAPIMQVFARLMRPLVWGMSTATSAVLFLLGAHKQDGPTVSVDDIEHLLEAGRAEGVLEAVEQSVAAEALRLGERTVRDIMRPRIDLDALDIETPPGEILGAIAMAGYSRLPVYEGSLDHILGYVSIKDVLRNTFLGWPIELRKMMHRPVFVPETMPLDRLLELFQKEKNQLAIVLDEYGGTEGMVTLEDVLEELVGEIHDEHRREEARVFVQREDGSWLVDGGAGVEELAKRFDLKLDAMPREYSTISGLVMAELERIPVAGDVVRWRGLVVEVVDMDGRRIDKLLVRRE
jgi:putative hemolysin